VMVRGDMPMDVFLELPKGASDAPKPDAPKTAEPQAPDEKRTQHVGEPGRGSKPKPAAAAPPGAVAEPNMPGDATSVPVQQAAAPSAPATKHAASAATHARPEPEKPAALAGGEATAQHQAAPVTPAPAPAQKPQGIPDNPF